MLHMLRNYSGHVVGSRMCELGKNLFDTTIDSDALPSIEKLALSMPTLYLHVPFCHEPLCEMCPFCRQAFKHAVAARYMEDLGTELTRYKDLNFTSIYIGGGTPATVLPELMELVQEFAPNVEELSVEAHPTDLTEKNLQIMKAAGVTRLSVGVQSFDESLLKLMGRSNGRNPIENLYRAMDYFVVNADLIYNFAGQTIEQFVQDIDTLIEMSVPQITCYPLMAAPGSFSQVDDSKERQYYWAMLDRFKASGYTALTPWAFTRLPDGSQGEYISNSGSEEYLGVGASSISKIGSIFTINTYNLEQYHAQIQQSQIPLGGMKKVSRTENIQYFLLTSLFGMSVDMNTLSNNQYEIGLIKTEVQALRMLGLVTINDGIVTPTEEGMYFLSRVMKSFYTGLNFFRATLKEHAAAH